MSGEFNQIKETLVDKILDQGQRLRNSMVQSILQNDPLSSDLFLRKTHNTPVSSMSSLTTRSAADKKLLEAFISGDYLSKEEEELALETIRSLPASEVCETTEKTLSNRCTCSTCLSYHENNLKCHMRRENKDLPCQKDHIRAEPLPEPKSNSEFTDILKQVDSLRVSLQSIHLNELGNKKVVQSCNKPNSYGLSQSYFVEYIIPEIFLKQGLKTRSKVDTGLKSNHFSVCARGSSNVIHLKQVFTHAVNNLSSHNLDNHDLIFLIKFKNSGPKKSESLGIARLNFGVFKESETASCGKSLPIFLDEDSCIALGTLKVTVQLGAGKIYFGKEFVDAVLTSKTIRAADISDESDNELLDKREVYFDIDTKENLPSEPKKTTPRKVKSSLVSEINFKSISSQKLKNTVRKSQLKEELSDRSEKTPVKLIEPPEEDILFGFIYISEAQLLNFSPNSYVLCQPFCQTDTSASRIVYNNSNPLYNFCQNIPLVYDENLLLKLRENFTVLEFWHTTGQTEELFGLTRIPLHQFYLGYRNSIILKHLKKNKLPIIGTDWWEPIYSPESKELIGQVQILTALGTEDQIKNLEEERGFRDDIVKAKFSKIKDIPVSKPPNYWSHREKVTKKSTEFNTIEKKRFLVKPEHTDKETQSVMEEENKKPQSQDMLASFLKLLEQRQRPPCVENGTNTEPIPNKPSSTEIPHSSELYQTQKRNTSDLLDSLQVALSLDSKSQNPEKPPHFRAQVVINAANQLPSRRKIKNKSKRLKNKSAKHEENILPSTYVTFETLPNEPLQMTNVCPKSTSPQWGYCCEVNLPRDLLTNPQKRLIFKVWKKSTNAVLQPNLQTDLVLGFAALDLSVLSCGLPNVRGWFNIVDFSGKCNGQINIHVNPLEKVNKTQQVSVLPETLNSGSSGLNNLIPDNEECNEVLSRALKRKFTELDEITQRLRLRLSEVVSEDSENSNDDMAEEFEQDINNLSIEEDFHLVDFEDEARKFSQILSAQKQGQKKEASKNKECNEESTDTSEKVEESKKESDKSAAEQNGSSILLMSSNEDQDKQEICGGTSTESSTARSFDKHIIEGKHRIDTLLEKLSLINTVDPNQPFSSRYISGCSTTTNDPQEDVEFVFKALDRNSRPNITATNRFDPIEFQQLYGGSMSKEKLNSDDSSGTSVITNFSECRPNPVGQGTSEEKKS